MSTTDSRGDASGEVPGSSSRPLDIPPDAPSDVSLAPSGAAGAEPAAAPTGGRADEPAARDGDGQGPDGPSGPGGPEGDAEEQHPPHRRRRISAWAEMPILIGIALVLAMLVKAFLVQAFYIPSGSMEQTLRVGDRVLVDKVSYRFGDIERGDIVVFNGVDSFTPEVTYDEPSNPIAKAVRAVGSAIGIAPPDERDFIKRVIGLPGDRVASDGQGPVTVNGVPLEEEDYLFPGDDPSDQPFDVTVPADRLWVLGDHRNASADSRAHQGEPGGGFVPVDKVIGKAFVVVWPFGHWRTLGTPDTFDQAEIDRRATGVGAELGG
ncbi:signal peptidase I [Motilibacter aurantiacus]|uniref:signal peptidase I n=1 Tax=Motilibacter aurantiacus TaxID=2714955 RepID=UPI00140C7BE1|nr:signal peptidase I [Motilibacter aurantiacus]NHC44634.1 signal peptidase I [Motilibacter aurantiacus]